MIYRFSPSQISAYWECKRKWGFGSIAKIRGPQNGSAAFGSETHTQIEHLLRGQQLDYSKDSGYVAASGVQHFPVPNAPGLILEGKIYFQSPETGYFYSGFRDAYLPGSPPTIYDWKTTSNLKWAKTPEDLLTDPQAVIYARSENTDGPVNLKWVYLQTKGARKSLAVTQTMERAHVLKEFAALELTSVEMAHTVDAAANEEDKKAFVLTLEPSPSACEKFGGCPHRSICNLGPGDIIKSFFVKPTAKDNNLMSVDSLINRLRAQNTQATPTVTPTPEGGVKVSEPSGDVTFSKDFINPPPLPPVLDPVQATPSPQAVDKILATYEAEVKAEEKVKRTRRTKAEMEAARAPSAAERTAPLFTQELDDAQISRAQTENAGEDMTPEKQSYTLYIDCVPPTYTDASELYELANKAVCEKAGVPDYRLLKYGEGQGLLVVAMKDLIDQGFVTGAVFVNTNLAQAGICLSLLQSHASRVVMSTR